MLPSVPLVRAVDGVLKATEKVFVSERNDVFVFEKNIVSQQLSKNTESQPAGFKIACILFGFFVYHGVQLARFQQIEALERRQGNA